MACVDGRTESFPQGPIFVAQFDYYNRNTRKKLICKSGELLEVICQDEDWWQARSLATGIECCIPSNYVEKCKGPVYIAQFDYNQIESEELSFKKGEQLEIIDQEDWRWARSLATGMEGYIPNNYVEKCKGSVYIAQLDYKQIEREDLSFKKGEQLVINSTVNKHWWWARSLATGMEGYIPNDCVKCKGPVYIAQFDYNQIESEDMSFKKGEQLVIISHDNEDWRWARSLVTQREGYIPSNHVQKCEESILVVQFDYYDQHTSEDLSFKKGEQLEIISQDDEDWWQARSLVSRREGYIPSSYVEECKTIETEWMASGFFGPIKQEEAEALLRAHGEKGTFLIREHESKQGDFMLSVHDGENVKHYHIERLDEGGYFITRQTVFNTLKELTEYYQRDSDELCVNLRYPCPQQEKPRINSLSHKTRNMLEISRESIHLVKTLGKGGFGEVYEGVWNGTTPVAVRILNSGVLKAKLIREAHIMKKLQHPNIVQFYAVCTSEEPLLMVTELMTKGNLLKYLRSGEGSTQTLPQLINMSAQIASGMAYLESHDCIHRSLKASNIMVCKNGICRVADFGLVNLMYPARYPTMWTAPEVVLYENFNNKSDVWSFGILLTELVTYGYPPYPGITEEEVLAKVEQGYRMPCPPNTPESVYQIMLECWKEDPDDRPTFETLQQMLDTFLESVIKSGFFGPIKQEEAEALLQAHEEKGTFLIREHESKPGDFVLSVHDGDNVKHYHIERLDDGGYFITWRTVFNTLKELTEYYQRDSDELCVNLRHPCSVEIPRESIHLVKTLGKGEFGEVYEGVWNGTTPVAVRILNSGVIRANLIREAHIMKKLHHPNIVQFYAVYTREEPLLMVTELMAKGSLLKYLRSGEGRTQTLPQLIDMSAQIASGMAYLGSHDCIHKSLKASNIMICKNGICRVADFGLVNLVYPARFPIRWISPEVVLYERLNMKSDVWSFGILLTELVTYGCLPYLGMSISEVEEQVKQGYRMPCPPNTPTSLYQIMLKCWKEDPDDRPTFETLQRMLDTFLESVVKLYSISGFFGPVNRAEAEALLRAHEEKGTFLIREHESKPGDFVLSVHDGDNVKHYHIERLEEGGYFITQGTVFNTLKELTEYYQRDSDELCFNLRHPCSLSHPGMWEIPLESIHLVKTLGKGEFGEVYKGVWNGTTPVAVRILNSGVLKAKLIWEAHIMKKLHHTNIVQFYAVCTREEPLLMVTELMAKGNLLKYLQLGEGRTQTLPQLIDMSAQIASGMAYLGSHDCIHKSLKASNIMICKNGICRVADFGLVNLMYPARFYIRWTAPEVVLYEKFNIKSDVWSFGILLIELMTYGRLPYLGMSNSEVEEQLKQGYRMPCPPNTPKSLYQIMLECWKEDPDDRPTFETLQQMLDTFLESVVKLYSISGFFGPINRAEAEALLRAHEEKGTFLIREHESKPGDFVLSVHDGDNVKHCHIERVDEGGYFITRGTVFNTLKELTAYYQRDSDELCVNLCHSCSLSHPRTWEIPLESIHLVKTLGKGEFGEVYEGVWNGTTPVAVRILNSGVLKAKLIWEAHIMKKLHHPNIMQFYGVCTREEPLLMVTELMAKGNLLKYLRLGEGRTQTLPQLIDMSAQIASGMAYLESHEYIHRNLRARSIMVCRNGICKVANFGLIALEYPIIYPIKWTAPEAALYNRFSMKSDVWSFGILLTELVTYGCPPYPGMANEEVLAKVEQGYRMPCPPNTPESLYQIMLDCWKEDPDDRYTFETLLWRLEDFFFQDSVVKMYSKDLF